MEKSERIAALSIFVDIVLLAIKYTFAMLSGSVGLAAETMREALWEHGVVLEGEVNANNYAG